MGSFQTINCPASCGEEDIRLFCTSTVPPQRLPGTVPPNGFGGARDARRSLALVTGGPLRWSTAQPRPWPSFFHWDSRPTRQGQGRAGRISDEQAGKEVEKNIRQNDALSFFSNNRESAIYRILGLCGHAACCCANLQAS